MLLDLLPSCAVLKAAPGDVDACKCKAMAYIQLGDFESAMQMLNTKVLANTMQYERVRPNTMQAMCFR